MADLELVTVGRISIGLYCGELGAGWHEATSGALCHGLLSGWDAEAMPALLGEREAA